MHIVKIQIAGITIEIKTRYLRNFDVFKDFSTERDSDCKIAITQEDIDLVRDKFEREQGFLTEWAGYYEAFAILRKVAEALIEFDTLLMHGAVISVENESYLFTAPSGIGKTTHAMKWINSIPGAFVVNGDKPFIKVDEGLTIACGSPWAGKENIYKNIMVPLKAIVLLERSNNNAIRQISFFEAFPTLFQQVYRANDVEKVKKTILLMKRMSTSVSLYRFQMNNFKDDCLQVAYEALTGNKLSL